jgi:hypothetical protein
VTTAFPTASPQIALEECLSVLFAVSPAVSASSHELHPTWPSSLTVFCLLAIFITISKAYCECPLSINVHALDDIKGSPISRCCSALLFESLNLLFKICNLSHCLLRCTQPKLRDLCPDLMRPLVPEGGPSYASLSPRAYRWSRTSSVSPAPSSISCKYSPPAP